MSSIHRDYVPIPAAADGRFWCVDTGFIESEGIYETMVFDAVLLPDGPFDFDVSYDEVGIVMRTSDIDKAYENHKEMVYKMSNITREEAYGQRSEI